MYCAGCMILLALGSSCVLPKVSRQSLPMKRHALSSIRFPRIYVLSLFALALQTAKADEVSSQPR